MFIFKILAAPFVLLLTVLVMVLSFLSSAAAAVLNIISVILVILSAYSVFIEKIRHPPSSDLWARSSCPPTACPRWRTGSLESWTG